MAYEKKLFNANGFQGASLPSTQGDTGLVPAPSGPDADHFLRGNGQWDDVNAPFMNSVTTSDATPTALWSLPLSSDTTYSLSADIMVLKPSSSTIHGAFLRRALTWRVGASTAVMSTLSATGEAGQIVGQDDKDNAGLAVAFTLNGNVAQLSVTGVAATNLSWLAKVTFMKLENQILPQ